MATGNITAPNRDQRGPGEETWGVVTWMLIAIAGWLTVTVVVGLFAWSLVRVAAIGDRRELEQMDQRAVEADLRTSDRRVGPEDRRDAIRPWAVEATGRRAEDALRRNLAEAHRLLRDAETRLAEIEARQSA